MPLGTTLAGLPVSGRNSVWLCEYRLMSPLKLNTNTGLPGLFRVSEATRLGVVWFIRVVYVCVLVYSSWLLRLFNDGLVICIDHVYHTFVLTRVIKKSK